MCRRAPLFPDRCGTFVGQTLCFIRAKKDFWVLANVLRLRTRTPRGEIKLLTLRTETKTKVAGSDYSGGRAIWLHNWTLIATFFCCQRGKGSASFKRC